MTVRELKNKDHLNDYKERYDLFVIDAYNDACRPCKLIAPKIAKLSECYKNVGFFKLDVDCLCSLAKELKIEVLPTFLFVDRKWKELHSRVTGAGKDTDKRIAEIINGILD